MATEAFFRALAGNLSISLSALLIMTWSGEMDGFGCYVNYCSRITTHFENALGWKQSGRAGSVETTSPYRVLFVEKKEERACVIGASFGGRSMCVLITSPCLFSESVL